MMGFIVKRFLEGGVCCFFSFCSSWREILIVKRFLEGGAGCFFSFCSSWREILVVGVGFLFFLKACVELSL